MFSKKDKILCTICYSPNEDTSYATLSCCSHVFCIECTNSWVALKGSCPIDGYSIEAITCYSSKGEVTYNKNMIKLMKDALDDRIRQLSATTILKCNEALETFKTVQEFFKNNQKNFEKIDDGIFKNLLNYRNLWAIFLDMVNTAEPFFNRSVEQLDYLEGKHIEKNSLIFDTPLNDDLQEEEMAQTRRKVVDLNYLSFELKQIRRQYEIISLILKKIRLVLQPELEVKKGIEGIIAFVGGFYELKFHCKRLNQYATSINFVHGIKCMLLDFREVSDLSHHYGISKDHCIICGFGLNEVNHAKFDHCGHSICVTCTNHVYLASPICPHDHVAGNGDMSLVSHHHEQEMVRLPGYILSNYESEFIHLLKIALICCDQTLIPILKARVVIKEVFAPFEEIKMCITYVKVFNNVVMHEEDTKRTLSVVYKRIDKMKASLNSYRNLPRELLEIVNKTYSLNRLSDFISETFIGNLRNIFYLIESNEMDFNKRFDDKLIANSLKDIQNILENLEDYEDNFDKCLCALLGTSMKYLRIL